MIWLPLTSRDYGAAPKGLLLIDVLENATFPNWQGVAQTRNYQLEGDELSYRVPARPDGNTPSSIWRLLN